MKSLYKCFVSLARSAHHEAMIHRQMSKHGWGSIADEQAAEWEQRAHDHMASARRCKFFDCYSCK